MNPADALKRRPKRVAMVGLGPSANAFWLECANWNALLEWDEVWTINRGGCAFEHDVEWNMHDLREMCREYPNEYPRLLRSKTPIMTVKAYPEFPMAVEFPVLDVLNHVEHDIMNSTPAYMAAYALMIGVQEVFLFGMDFHYVNHDRAEAGGQGFAYMLGMFQARGVKYKMPNTSSLLDAYKAFLVRPPGWKPGDPEGQVMRPLYGYSIENDPRIPVGATVIHVGTPQQMMTAHDPPYRLSQQAAEGDQVPGGQHAHAQDAPLREGAPRAVGGERPPGAGDAVPPPDALGPDGLHPVGTHLLGGRA